MGTFIKIELKTKTDANIKKHNNILNKTGVDGRFMSEQDFIVAAEMDKTTVEDIKERWKYFYRLGFLMFDVAYTRTSDETASLYAQYILNNKKSIASIDNADELISRYTLTPEQIQVIKTFVVEDEEPEKLPLDQQHKPTLQSGLLLCKSFSPEPFWVVFGNVERPTFMKEKIYVEEIYNNIYRDKKGYAYMLLPLMPVDNRQVEFCEEVYEQALNMGLREDPAFFLPIIYVLDMINLVKVTNSYKDSYTQKELRERFESYLSQVNDLKHYDTYGGLIWNDVKGKFVPIMKDDMLMTSKANVLTCLVRAIDDKKIVAEIMSKTLNKIFREFEFKNTVSQ